MQKRADVCAGNILRARNKVSSLAQNVNSFHRQQLRRVLNVKYPAHISNEQVYGQTGEDVLSLEVLRNRWKLFGHVLRSHPETPAQKAMN